MNPAVLGVSFIRLALTMSYELLQQPCCFIPLGGLVLGFVGAILTSVEKHNKLKMEQQAIELERKKRAAEILILEENRTVLVNEIAQIIELLFMVQPCHRCHELKMQLLDVSPNGRSIKYQCHHCKKKMHAVAGTPESSQIIEVWASLKEVEHSIGYTMMPVYFDAPAAPLPYEQTSRTPIPEAVRSEVWRRDGGRCVNCGSNNNLQFDHIIPVTLGGATSVANLQLLCQPCNASKGKKI
jgi:hypothetical protein